MKKMYYYSAGKTKFYQYGTEADAKRHPVSGKKEARQIAEKEGAVCWNF